MTGERAHAPDNHFHIVCTVNIPEGPVPEEVEKEVKDITTS